MISLPVRTGASLEVTGAEPQELAFTGLDVDILFIQPGEHFPRGRARNRLFRDELPLRFRLNFIPDHALSVRSHGEQGMERRQEPAAARRGRGLLPQEMHLAGPQVAQQPGDAVLAAQIEQVVKDARAGVGTHHVHGRADECHSRWFEKGRRQAAEIADLHRLNDACRLHLVFRLPPRIFVTKDSRRSGHDHEQADHSSCDHRSLP